MSEPLIMDGVRIYGVLDRGNLWCMIRATDKATFDAQALDVGLKVYANGVDGDLVPVRGVTIAEIGALVLKETEVDAAGVVVSAAVTDDRYHVNFWLDAETVARDTWMQWATLWTYYGIAVVPNNQEDGTAMQGIELIDPATVISPRNVLL